MRIPDAIAPYASLIKWCLIAALFATLFIGGCVHGTGKQFVKDRKAIDAADKRANGYAAQVAVLSTTIQLIDAETANAVALAAEQAKRADVAAKRADQAQAEYQQALGDINRDIADTVKRDPACAEQLRKPVCAALR